MPIATSVKGLREERAALVKHARSNILEKAEAEGRDLNAEEQQKWTEIMGGRDPQGKEVRGQVDVLKDRIDRLEALDTKDRELAALVGDPRVGRDPIDPRDLRIANAGGDGAALFANPRTHALALQAWAGFGRNGSINDQQAQACKALGINPSASELIINLDNQNYLNDVQATILGNGDKFRQSALAALGLPKFGATAAAPLSGISGPGGGYLFPETFVRNLEVNMLAYGGILQAAEIMRTETGERMGWPTVDDTAQKGLRLNENAQVPNTTTNPTFGKDFWDAYDYSSDVILVPYRLLRDQVVDLPGVLGELLGIRLGRKIALDCTTGNGANAPKGIVTCASTGVTSASATAIAFDDIISLIYSVDPAYRANGRFMFHDQVLAAVRKLKDGVGRYLWDPSTQSGAPDRLWGYPYTVSMEMASTIAANNVVMLFGQLFKYKVRQVAQIRLYRLQERYRDSDQDGFLAFIAADGNLLTAGTTPVKSYVMHS